MKKITIEIEYEEEKDLFFHLGIVRTSIKTILKTKLLSAPEFDRKIEQSSIGGSHTIEFQK